MSAIDEFANDLNVTLADLDAQFKELNIRKQKVKERGAEVALRWKQFFAEKDRAISAAEDALNRVSNVPVSQQPPVLPKDVPLTMVPKIAP